MTTIPTTPTDPLRLDDFLPDRRMSASQHRELIPEDQSPGPGFFRVAGDAFSTVWAGSWAVRQFQSGAFRVNPSFRLTKPLMDELTEGIPEDYWPMLDDAVSDEHAQHIRESMLSLTERRQRLAEAGWTGIGLQIGAALTDPVFIGTAAAASALTGGPGGAAVLATRATRLQRFVRHGLVLSASEGAVMGYIATQDPETDAMDAIHAALAAFTLGGTVGVWVGGRLDRAARSWRRQIELDEIRGAGLELSEDGLAYFAKEISDDGRKIALKRVLDSIEDMPQATRDAVAKMDGDEILAWLNVRTPSAARAAEEAVEGAVEGALSRRAADLDFGHVPTPGRDTGPVAGLRFDMAGRLARSPVPLVRRLGHLLAENPIPRADGTPTIGSASEWKTRMTRVLMGRYHGEANDAFSAWRKAHGRGALTELSDRVDFMEEVGKAIRRESGFYTRDPHVNRVADMQRRMYAEVLGIGKRHRVRGFGDIAEADTYLPRIYSHAKIHKAIDQHGRAAVVRMFRDAIIRNSDDLTIEQAEKIASAHLRNIQNLERTTPLENARMFSHDQSEMLAKVLREEGLPDAQIEDIIYATAARPGDAGKMARAKRRLDLDDTMIEGLLENNAEALMEMYTRQVLGHSAMSRVYDAMGRGSDDVITSWDGLVNRITKEADDLGHGASKKIKRDLKRLETLYRSVVDLPLGGELGTGFHEWTRHLRALQFMRVMGQAGFPQAVETSMILGEGGVVAALRRIPSAVKLIGKARAGDLDDASIRQIETLWGFGTDRTRNQLTSRFDASESLRDFGGGRLDMYMRAGTRFTADVSGIAPISVMQQRVAAGVAMDTWAHIAASGNLPSKARLASMGLTPDDAVKIVRQIKQHSHTYKGVTGRQMRDVNIDAWTDVEAASRFIVAVDKWGRRVIQQNDIGNLAQWMTTDIGRVILQFRIFPAVAWSKHLLHGARMHDSAVASTAAIGLGLSGMLYVARTYVNSLGREDAEEYRAERLTWDRIAAGAVYHNPYSSLLPMVADTGAYLAGVDQPFQFTRSTGLASNVFFSNPTQDHLDQLGSGLRGVVNLAAPGRTFTQRDAQAIAKAAPFQNVLGWSNFINALTANLPEDD